MRTAKRIRKDKAVERVRDALLNERPFLLNRFRGEQRKIKNGPTIYCIILAGEYVIRKKRPEVIGPFSPYPVFIKEENLLYISSEAAKKNSYDKKLIRKVMRDLRNQNIPYHQMDIHQMEFLATKGTAAFVRHRFITPCKTCGDGTLYTDPQPCPDCGNQK